MSRPASDPLASFSPATRRWFEDAFATPTAVQARGWPAIARGEHTLLLAPTGSGKTLAAFLACLDRLFALPPSAEPGVRVLYVSPLKALAHDIERNLRAPLAGISRAAAELAAAGQAGERSPDGPQKSTNVRSVLSAIRTGDTPAAERRRLVKEPPDILITTPESLYLMLGSQARAILRTVEVVIVDEIHALAPSKRGAHLALSLERLVDLCGRDVQRIGLSATQRPLDEVARYLAGERPVTIVDAGEPPRLDLVVEVADPEARPEAGVVDEAAAEERRGAWPGIHVRVLELIRAHRSTIVFVNSRRLCERLAGRLNDLAGVAPGGDPLVRAHHGSIARPQRIEIEEALKAGRLKGIVATSSLELGVDMAAVDLVIQIESPGSVARGLQRVGRAGHGVGQRSTARILPKHAGDLLEATVAARRMLDGEVEPIRVPRNPLDVLAQQIVATCADRPWKVDDLHAMIRRTYSYATLSRDLLGAVLDMLAGRYPSEDFPDLRPRVVWDRATDEIASRRDARLVSVLNAGTIPDRGTYAVHLGQDGPRIGELDEEMVHETRAGQTFLLGASSWRVVEITRDRVIVRPAPGEPGKMPFWRGEGPGRPVELGRALGAFVRELEGKKHERSFGAWLRKTHRLDARAATDLAAYIGEQHEATGALPTDRTIVVERFRDELGDWRVCILSPFGARVHAPWALALEARLAKARGLEVQTLWSDDGIVLRFADTDAPPDVSELVLDPDEIEELLVSELARSALFATHFRENASRALLLPRRRAGGRTPLWAQRLRAQGLLEVATRHPGFPIVLETYREVLKDVFDVPALVGLLRQIRAREVEVVPVETRSASPFARSLAFAWMASFIYEGDAPLAERRAQALALDRGLLRDLLGEEELRELLDPEAITAVDEELQALAPERRARHADALHDLLRRLGDLSEDELGARSDGDPAPWLAELQAAGRAVRVRVGRPAEARWVAVEDVARYRDALGIPPPPGVAAIWLEPASRPLEALVQRFARTHAPFVPATLAKRLGVTVGQLDPVVRILVASGRLLEGELTPGRTGLELCDPDVLRRIRRETLARLRHEVAPVEAAVLARFLPAWHGVGGDRTGALALRAAIDKLEGIALPFSELERELLPARVADFQPRMLDELGAAGELIWVGRGALGGDDGRVALYWRHHAPALITGDEPPALEPLASALLERLDTRGASFFAELAAALPGALSGDVLRALWDLVWAGLVTNDTFAPLRALGRSGRNARARAAASSPGGRWSALAQLRRDTSPEAVAHARAVMLLERYGVVSREAAVAEGIPGGFSALATVLRAMEEAGKVRRGHFVEGLGGMQFAHPGAVDRLRASRGGEDATEVAVLSALDPAQPYGTLLPWPDGDEAARPRRVAGARVILVDGAPIFYLERGGGRLRVLARDLDDAVLAAALDGLRRVAALRRHGELRVREIDGEPALRSRLADRLARGGFRIEPSALVLAPGE